MERSAWSSPQQTKTPSSLGWEWSRGNHLRHIFWAFENVLIFIQGIILELLFTRVIGLECLLNVHSGGFRLRVSKVDE